MNNSTDLASLIPCELDSVTIQNIITAIELANCHGRNGLRVSAVYCSQGGSPGNKILGIHFRSEEVKEDEE